MKKAITIALVLAVVASLSFGSVALADEGVHTKWNFDGTGSIGIHTESYGISTGSESHLFVETTGSHSWGYEYVSASQETPYGPYPYDYGFNTTGTDFKVERYAEIDDGVIEGYFLRDNPEWEAHTEYGASLKTDGYGSLHQEFSNTYWDATFYSHIEADCPYLMKAGVECLGPAIGGYFSFGIGAEGDGSGILDVNFTDRPQKWGTGTRLLYGDFSLFADPAEAGFGTSWANIAEFGATVQTGTYDSNDDPVTDITTHVGTYDSEGKLVRFVGPGNLNSGAYSDDWVTINGFINQMK